MKKIILLLTIFLMSGVCFSQTHDSIFIAGIKCDTLYDTLQVPDVVPSVKLNGMYVHPDDVTIGNSSSENMFLGWAKREGVNMLNQYSRSYLYTEAKRAQLAAYVKKAKEQYGIIIVTVDWRFTDNRERDGWIAYFEKYKGTISMIEPLAEFEPYVLNSDGKYDDKYLPTYQLKYNHFFWMLPEMKKICKQYGVKINWYEGWIGNNYSNPQAAVDSMVKYCDRIFISNYISISDFNSLGAWDNRMDKRCAAIAKSKKLIDIVEIISLQTKYSFYLYACPTTSVNKCNSFYGQLYLKAVSAYEQSTSEVLKYTDLTGRTMFVSYTAKNAHKP